MLVIKHSHGDRRWYGDNGHIKEFRPTNLYKNKGLLIYFFIVALHLSPTKYIIRSRALYWCKSRTRYQVTKDCHIIPFYNITFYNIYMNHVKVSSI